MADRDANPQKELEDLKKAQEELVFENNQLKEQNKNYDNVVVQLKEAASSVNISNARLLYTNRVLRNTSLNERQKDKIVEAISGAGSVTEAKMIYETLQSTVESTPSRAPQSLNEAIGRNRASVIRASREKSTTSDPWSDRMKKLAGIN
jgi:predicted nuclease with TOPRIM domain